ncbi:MAG: hypothetical protein KF779_17025 [Hyphomonadaceae bacterium]|nr:hypothetical protein [Hyphomonadaceae bacterium]
MKFLLIALGAALSAFSGQASAQDYQSPTIGGPGGEPFTMRCAQGDFLVGLRARSGDWVDAIAPLCARWDERRQRFLAPGIGPVRGGNGGGLVEIRCNEISALKSLVVEHAPNRYRNVALIVPACASGRDPTRTTGRLGAAQFGTSIADRRDREAEPGIGSTTSTFYDADRMPHCNGSDLAVGIFGGAGNYVDRIGLICAPPPRTTAAATRRLPPPSDLANMGRGATPAPSRRRAEVSATPGIAPGEPNGRDCRTGFVWREARPGDVVCVTPESRTLVRHENASATARVSPGGAYGPHTCIAGFVWREAFDGDVVCVTPERRSQVREENATAVTRVAG